MVANRSDAKVGVIQVDHFVLVPVPKCRLPTVAILGKPQAIMSRLILFGSKIPSVGEPSLSLWLLGSKDNGPMARSNRA
jgi:hypothetical protein